LRRCRGDLTQPAAAEKYTLLCQERDSLQRYVMEERRLHAEEERAQADRELAEQRLMAELEKETRTMVPFGLRPWTAEELDHVKSELCKPVPPHLVRKLPKGSTQLSYVEVGEVIKAANRIFGEFNWMKQVLTLEEVKPSCNGPDWVEYKCTMVITLKDGTKEWDTGSGINPLKAPDAGDTARKSAVSDATKRCLARFGPALGLDLKCKEGREEMEVREREHKRLKESGRGPPQPPQQQRRPTTGTLAPASAMMTASAAARPSVQPPFVQPLVLQAPRAAHASPAQASQLSVDAQLDRPSLQPVTARPAPASVAAPIPSSAAAPPLSLSALAQQPPPPPPPQPPGQAADDDAFLRQLEAMENSHRANKSKV